MGNIYGEEKNNIGDYIEKILNPTDNTGTRMVILKKRNYFSSFSCYGFFVIETGSLLISIKNKIKMTKS